jgi:hypothetical protein
VLYLLLNCSKIASKMIRVRTCSFTAWPLLLSSSPHSSTCSIYPVIPDTRFDFPQRHVFLSPQVSHKPPISTNRCLSTAAAAMSDANDGAREVNAPNMGNLNAQFQSGFTQIINHLCHHDSMSRHLNITLSFKLICMLTRIQSLASVSSLPSTATSAVGAQRVARRRRATWRTIP